MFQSPAAENRSIHCNKAAARPRVLAGRSRRTRCRARQRPASVILPVIPIRTVIQTDECLAFPNGDFINGLAIELRIGLSCRQLFCSSLASHKNHFEQRAHQYEPRKAESITSEHIGQIMIGMEDATKALKEHKQ
jgi:hypothetical protein